MCRQLQAALIPSAIVSIWRAGHSCWGGFTQVPGDNVVAGVLMHRWRSEVDLHCCLATTATQRNMCVAHVVDHDVDLLDALEFDLAEEAQSTTMFPPCKMPPGAIQTPKLSPLKLLSKVHRRIPCQNQPEVRRSGVDQCSRHLHTTSLCDDSHQSISERSIPFSHEDSVGDCQRDGIGKQYENRQKLEIVRLTPVDAFVQATQREGVSKNALLDQFTKFAHGEWLELLTQCGTLCCRH